jgi:hypothetical protein
MTMIGIDPHKATHTAVAVDDDENVIDEFTLEAADDQGERRYVRMGTYDSAPDKHDRRHGE